jgi:hypothetical protein
MVEAATVKKVVDKLPVVRFVKELILVGFITTLLAIKFPGIVRS